MTVLLQDLTQRNSVLPVTKDTVTACQAIVVVFFNQLISEIILWLCFGPPSSGDFFLGPMPNLLADPWPICFQCTHYWDGCTKQRSAEIIWESMLCVCRCFRYSWWWTATWEGCSTLCVGIVSNVEISGGRSQNVCVVPLPTLRIMLVQLLFEWGCLLAFSRRFHSSNCWCLGAQCVLQRSGEDCELSSSFVKLLALSLSLKLKVQLNTFP